MFGQTDILEFVNEHQILATNVKCIKEFYHIDHGDTVETNPVLSNEFWFNKKGNLIKEIEFKKFIDKGDTVKVENNYYKDSLITRKLISTYPRFDTDSIEEFEIIYKYEYVGNRLVRYNRDDSYKEYYFYNELGLIDTLISNWYFDKTSIYKYRDNGSLKRKDTYESEYSFNSNKINEIESTAFYDHFNREIKYKRFTSGNSHTTRYRKFKYNENGKITMSIRKTVEDWRIIKHYTYNQQELVTSIKVKQLYPRSISYEIQIKNDSEDSSEKIKRSQKSNREIEKRAVVKSHYLYKYNSNNLPIQITVDNDQRVLSPVVRTFIYEYYWLIEK